RVESSCRYGNPYYDEVFLVANIPNDKVLRNSLLVAFAKKTMPDFCDLKADVISYSLAFYENTRCTRSFDERNLGHGWSLSSDDEGCPDDEISFFYWYKRSEDNPKKWYLYRPQNMIDTIYCQ